MNKYEPVIGLEVHAQLLTETKAFCGCSNKFGAKPNTNICPICLGHPGSLPKINRKMVEFAVMMGLATNCRINFHSTFARKNYFYPDLPKGWQTSQFDEPICTNGFIPINTGDNYKEIRINRIHMEEDAGKLIHDNGGFSLVDLNRCGTPLIEIVSEPDLHSPNEAFQYLSKLKQILLYLNISDCNMEEGSLRCDANVSVRLAGEKSLGVKTELKNMNSFKNVEKAIQKEIERQIEIIEDGGKIIQQTLLWDADNEEIKVMRTKEEAHDYRYFPEPDLLPVIIDDSWLNELKSKMPELPDVKLKKFLDKYKLPEYDCEILTSTKELADYFENAAEHSEDYKSISNWIMVEVLKFINENNMSVNQFSLNPENLGRLVNLINDKTISNKIAKDIFPELIERNIDPAVIIKEKGLTQINDTKFIEEIIDHVINANQEQVKQYIAGKDKVLGFFVGQIMKESKGKANPQSVNELLIKKLSMLKN